MKRLLAAALLLSGIAAYTDHFFLIRDGKSTAVFESVSNRKVQQEIGYFNEDLVRSRVPALPVVKKPAKDAFVIRFQVEERTVPEEDSFRISFPDRKTMLITCSTFSAGNALRFILEEYVGVRYLFPAFVKAPYREDINHYPAVRNVSLPRRTVSKKASFYLNRTVDYRARAWLRRWGSRSRVLNGHMIPIDVFPVYKYAVDQSWPRNILPILRGKKFVPAKAKAPLSKNIYRAMQGYVAGWNPCFSHPDTTRIAIENILEILKKDPKRVSINMGINDNGGMCECANCRKGIRGRNNINMRNYSEIYWKWVNDVTREVTKKYPNVYVSCLAYREVIDPPSFKLHKNIVPQICFELNALNDKEIYAKRIKLLENWKKVCDVLDFWDYSYGLRYYLFPRIYFKTHSGYLKLLYDHHVRSIFVESFILYPFEGPKHYLMHKLLFDIKSDPEKIVMDWCTAAVGKESAVYLRKYYDFWEKYWLRDELKQTSWYASRFGTYMRLGDPGSYMLALRKGDMKYLRSLMDQVVAGAGTPEQKRRAGVLMECFKVSEDASCILFAGLLAPDGSLRNAADALLMLKQLPAALEAQKRLLENYYVKQHHSKGNLESAMLMHLGAVMPFLKDPAVRKEALRLAADSRIPALLRGMLRIWMGAKSPNLIINGSFEKATPRPMVHWNEGGAARTAERASEGKYSLSVPNCTYSFSIKAVPGKTYLFLFDAYIEQSSVEGRLNYMLTPRIGKRARIHYYYLNNTLPAGKWTTFTGVCRQSDKADNLQLMFYLRKLEKDDKVFLDNFRAYCLDDLDVVKTVKDRACVSKEKVRDPSALFRHRFDNEKFWKKNPACLTPRFGFGGSHKIIREGKNSCLSVQTTGDQVFMYNLNRAVPVKHGSKISITFRVKGKGSLSINPLGVTTEKKTVYLPSSAKKIDSDRWIDYTHYVVLKDKNKKNVFKTLLLRLNVEKNAHVRVKECIIRQEK